MTGSVLPAPHPQRSKFAPILIALSCAAAAILPYLPSLDADWVWDDHVLIVNNVSAIDQFDDAIANFSTPVVDSERVGYYRPVLIASFVMDYAMSGLDPRGFHRTNLVIHALNTALLFVLLYLLIGNRLAASLGALVFAWHPMQAQAVSLLLGRNDLLLATPMISAMLLWRVGANWEGWRRVVSWTGLSLLFAMALWTKETGIVLPLMLVAMDVMVAPTRWRLVRHRWPVLVIMGCVAAVYLMVRQGIFGAIADTGDYSDLAWYDRIRLAVAVFGYYVQHAALPWGLAPTPFRQALVDVGGNDFLLAALFSLGFAAALFFAYRRARIVALGLAWFGLGVCLVLGFAPMKLFILEHRTYVALIGVSLAVTAGVASFSGSRKGRIVLMAMLAVVLLGTGVATRARVPDFGSEMSLWTACSLNAPEAPKCRENLGLQLAKERRWTSAVANFERSLCLNPRSGLAHFRLGAALIEVGRTSEARYHAEEAIRLGHDDRRLLQRLEKLSLNE